MKPVVVVTLSRIGSPAHLANRAGYVRALEAAGAAVLALLPGEPEPERFDGLCLSGGGDVAPERSGAGAHPLIGDVDPARDALELSLVARALAAERPVLGICRGLQLLNVAFGGTLLPHVTGHTAEHGPVVPHVVTPAAGSRLAAAMGVGPCAVNSSHHQAVDARTLAPGLVATAMVPPLIEAFEHRGHRWVVGVQWHPERTGEVGAAAPRLIAAFVEAAAHGTVAAA